MAHRRHAKLGSAAGILLVVSLVGLGACSANVPAANNGDNTTLRVSWAGSSGPSVAALRDKVIQDNHLAKKNGMDLDILALPPDQAENGVLTGKVDVGFLAPIAWANAVANGRDLVNIISTQDNHGALMVKEDSPYHSLKDLKGKKIATLNPVSSMYTSSEVIAAKLGLDWKKDFELISAPPPGILSFLETGQVAAAVAFEPNVSRLVATGKYRVIFGLNEEYHKLTGGDSLQLTNLVASRAWLSQHPGALEKLRAMTREFKQLVYSNPNILEKYAKDPLDLDANAVSVIKKRLPDLYHPYTLRQMTASLQGLLDSATKLGIIKSVPKGPLYAQNNAE